VCVHAGGLATSSITTRTWLRGGYELHHIVDPATGLPSRGPWRTVSVAAASCVDANTASTAALVLGATAPSWLRDRQLPARLVHRDGSTVVVAGWPREER
jgi:thiamine biosynthesis lipoprotein